MPAERPGVAPGPKEGSPSPCAAEIPPSSYATLLRSFQTSARANEGEARLLEGSSPFPLSSRLPALLEALFRAFDASESPARPPSLAIGTVAAAAAAAPCPVASRSSSRAPLPSLLLYRQQAMSSPGAAQQPAAPPAAAPSAKPVPRRTSLDVLLKDGSLAAAAVGQAGLSLGLGSQDLTGLLLDPSLLQHMQSLPRGCWGRSWGLETCLLSNSAPPACRQG